jgi:hypothetical protein
MGKVVHMTVEGIEARKQELEAKLKELKAGGSEMKNKRLRVMRQLVQLRKAMEDPALRRDPEELQEKVQKDTQRRIEKKLQASKIATPTMLRCLGCKRKGHVLKDCRKNKTEEICYRCGATTHSSRDCLMETEDYPFAICFNCKKTGHLASSCTTKSKQGIYIRGGACFRCGSAWHLAKNCTEVPRGSGPVQG